VSYESQGGSAIANGTTTTGSSIASSPGTPSRAGYVFNGWYEGASGGNVIAFPYEHGKTGSFTLYGQWAVNRPTGGGAGGGAGGGGGGGEVQKSKKSKKGSSGSVKKSSGSSKKSAIKKSSKKSKKSGAKKPKKK
jgi:uncharacterized repeat protein (TIGR02543 family)